jgi:hypothetical protein
MHPRFAAVDTILTRMVQLADELRADPDGQVRRSVTELRNAFDTQAAMEPAVARVRRSMELLGLSNRDISRREFQRRAQGLDYLGRIVDDELLPDLRRLGFEV